MRLSAETLRGGSAAAELSRVAAELRAGGDLTGRLLVLDLAGDPSEERTPQAGPPGRYAALERAAEELCEALDGFRRRGGMVAAGSEDRVAGLLMELALLADVHLASDTAVFELPGLFDDYLPCLGTWTSLVGRVGSARARSLLLGPPDGPTGGLDAGTALQAGVCDAVIAPDRLAAALTDLGEALGGCSSYAQRMARRLGGRRRSFGFLTARQERVMESAAFALCFGSDHPREGIAAFFGGRKPHFHSTEDGS